MVGFRLYKLIFLINKSKELTETPNLSGSGCLIHEIIPLIHLLSKMFIQSNGLSLLAFIFK